jgi:hypothetical protein
MGMDNRSLVATMTHLVSMVTDQQLQVALKEAFYRAQGSVLKIEKFYTLLSTRAWSEERLAKFFCSWKATHLKMLAIYGLSCRLQRLAFATSDVTAREGFLLASVYNAETSYEDLGLDFGGETHADLYEMFAKTFLGEFPWQLEPFCVPRARRFQKWIYQNMVVSDISRGLLTNLFSEIYNHAEYTLALDSFSKLIDEHYCLSAEKKAQALSYIKVHVDGDTEVDHFLVVIKALEQYCQATGAEIDYTLASQLFEDYLTQLGMVMDNLLMELECENIDARLLCVS